MPLIIVFLNINHITIGSHKYFFQIKVLSQDRDSFLMILETAIISILTITLNLSPQTYVTLLFTIHIIQSITRALLLLHNKPQPMNFDVPHAHVLHFL